MTGPVSVFDWEIHFSCHSFMGWVVGTAAQSLSHPFSRMADGRSIMVMGMLILLIEFLVVVGCIFFLITLFALH